MFDTFLHFTGSFIITMCFLMFLLSRSPKRRDSAPRFWDSESKMRKSLFTIIFAFSLIAAVVFGIAKEWIDSLGFGNVEFKDFFADIAGIWVGVFFTYKKSKKENRIKRSLSFQSQSQVTSKDGWSPNQAPIFTPDDDRD